MIQLLPEPKTIRDDGGVTAPFSRIRVRYVSEADPARLLSIARLRFWNRGDIELSPDAGGDALVLTAIRSLSGIETKNEVLFRAQGYALLIEGADVILRYESDAGYINGITSLKQLLQGGSGLYRLPLCEIVDYPSVEVRAVAPTFAWYAGYGRIGFDMQLWGYEEWVEFLNVCLDNKLNQMNMVMYGYWPFDVPEYPETVLRDVPVRIWNAENRRWMTVRYTHPNLEEPYLERLIAFAHLMEVKLFAYVGLNSYNGGYTIRHPEARTKPPRTGGFLNDFDSLCLSEEGTVEYILHCMRTIARLGFDGFTLEESEEGFWYCECGRCKARWHAVSSSPAEAKHKANMWLLRQIYDAVREVSPGAVIGIRAFRQPPLVKDPSFLAECAAALPKDVMLFWAPGLYVPETEFPKWCAAFGPERIWGRDTESNAITSTMGRLYRVFETNLIRYRDETNAQSIERDIEQHIGSVNAGAHGINGFMFEWYGLFMHLFAHGNYGWGSRMEQEAFFRRACAFNFGEELGEQVLYVLRRMLTIHESQIPLYTTPFPFQKNKITSADIPVILAAKAAHPHLLQMIRDIRGRVCADPALRHFTPHFDKLETAERRNAVIYDLALAALRYEEETDPARKDAALDEILALNEQDFAIAREMFFDVNPVGQTGIKSCMFPYHEIKRLVYNIRHPQAPDNDIICSGVEALGWLWL